MSTYNRQTILTSYGNFPVKTDGVPVFLSGDGDDVYNVYTGEIVVFDQRQNITLSVADIATAKHISIAVGQGKKGDLASELVYLGGESFDLCKSSFNVNATTPFCGVPQVVDVFFDCTKCNDVYTLAFHLDDARVRSEYSFNEKAEYIFTVPTECCSCDDCTPEHNCEEVACAFVDQINGKVQKDPSKITYFQKANLADQYQPFSAARLFVGAKTSKRFNFDVDSTGTVAITGIKLDGVSTNFTFTSSTEDSSKTLPSQLKRVLEKINAALEPLGGSAVLKGSMNPATGYFIEINTCVADVELIGEAAAVILPTWEGNPFTAVAEQTVCTGCGVSPSEVNLSCGIRIFVDPVEVPCDCKYPPNMPVPSTYVRTIEPAFAGEGWVCHNHYWTESQELALPEGFGYFWQDRAHYGNHNGGSGRNWRYPNRRVGRIGLPDDHSRASNAAGMIECDETYCVYNMLETHRDNTRFNNNVGHWNTNLNYVLVPEGDTATKTSWELYLGALQERNLCSAGDIACGVKVTGVAITPTSDSVSATQAKATNSLDYNSVAPSNDDTITIGSRTYTYKTALTPAADEILIGANLGEAIDNTVAAITGGAGSGTLYGAGTVVNADVTAVNNADTSLDVTALLNGEPANSIATTDTLTDVGAAWTTATLTGGTGTVQFAAAVSPGTVSQLGTWSSSDTGVATVDATGLVTGVAAGTADIKFVASYDGVSYDIANITVTA